MLRYLLATLVLSMGACSTKEIDVYPDRGRQLVDWGADEARGGQDGGPDLPRADAPRADLMTPDASTPDIPPPAACAVAICMEGAFTHETAGNPIFGAICRQLPGLIEECVGTTCYPRFGMLGSDAAFEALLAKLDQNRDGRFDESDAPCEVQILGYSWGGVNAAKVAERFLSDARVAPSRRVVHKLILVDPYIPVSEVRVVEGVKSFWEYRHTVAPPGDCSAGALLGPYYGIAPSCHSSARCVDYDYSLAPNQSFNGYVGADVGHCTILHAAELSILHNVRSGTDDPAAPPSVPVTVF